MTIEERNEIFAKEYLSIADIEKLYGVNYPKASVIITDIKRILTIGRGQKLRWTCNGKIHIQDYLDYLGVTSDRYSTNYQGEKAECKN